MSTVVLILSLAGLAIGAYIITRSSRASASKVPGDTGGNAGIKGGQESPGYVLEDTSCLEGVTVEFEVHPLSRFKMIEVKFPEYLSRAGDKIQDSEEKAEFMSRGNRVVDCFQSFDPEPVLERIQRFGALQNSFFLSLEVEVSQVVEETVQLVNQLAVAPALLNLIETRVERICQFSDELVQLSEEWEQARNFEAVLQQNKDLILNKLKLLSDEELLEGELKEFVNLYFTLCSFELFEGFNAERLSEIERHQAFLQVIMSRSRSNLSDFDVREAQKIQKNILGLLRVIHDFYKKLYDGVYLMLEKFEQSRLKEMRAVRGEIQEALTLVEKDLLPVCERFSSRGGTLELDYNKTFQKILGAGSDSIRRSPIGLAAAENVNSFLSGRISDAKDLMGSEARKILKVPMKKLWEQIRRTLETPEE